MSALSSLTKYFTHSRNNIKRFNTDFYLVAYILIKDKSNINFPLTKTRFTKMVANILEDFDIIDSNYKSDFVNKPNPYGMVPAITNLQISKHKCPLHKLSEIAEDAGFWSIRGKKVTPLIPLEEVERILKRGEGMYHFSPFQLKILESLISIYSLFGDSESLNILVSHRNSDYRLECIEYEFRVWETSFQEFLKVLHLNNENSDLKKEIIHLLDFCTQIEKKIEYSLVGIKKIKQDLTEILNNTSDEYKKSLIQTLYDKITIPDTKEILNLNELYIFTRSFCIPITLGIINKFVPNNDLNKTNLNVIKRKPIIEIEFDPISPNLEVSNEDFLANLIRIHNQALNDGTGKHLLRSFPIFEETLSWDVGGKDEEEGEEEI